MWIPAAFFPNVSAMVRQLSSSAEGPWTGMPNRNATPVHLTSWVRGVALLFPFFLWAAGAPLALAQQLNRVEQDLAQKARVDFHGKDLVGKDGPLASVGMELALLYHEHRQFRKSGGARPFASQAVSARLVGEDSVTVDAVARGETSALASALRGLGAQNVASVQNLVSARVPIEKIPQIAALSSLQSARIPRPATPQAIRSKRSPVNEGSASPAVSAEPLVGDTDTQGDAAMVSDDVRTAFGIDGSGITVGVLSDSYDNSSASITASDDMMSGDLPPSDRITVLDDGVNGSDEGRAMMQLIYDVAPGVDLSFHTAFKGRANFADGIRELADNGADVIVDDVFYFREPFFQDGEITRAVDDVAGQGVSYFSSAGNSARQSYASTSFNTVTSGGVEYYDFDDSGSSTDRFQKVDIPVGERVRISFQWDDPFGSLSSGGRAADTDLDIFLVSKTTSSPDTLASSINNNVGGDPVEFIDFTNNGSTDADNDGNADTSFNLRIEQDDGPDPGRIKYFWSGSMTVQEFGTQSPTSVGHSNSSGGAGVAAAAYFDTPEFGQSPPLPENFTSLGGVPILFNDDGTRKSSSVTRDQPRFTGPDGGNTTFFGSSDIEGDGFPNFFGTSAAAPHAAAVAALQLQADPGQTPTEVYSSLSSSAIDMEQSGFDFLTGAGLVQAPEAIGNTADAVVNETAGSESTVPCDGSPDASTITNGSSQAGSGGTAFVCPGAYSPSTLDAQSRIFLTSGADATIGDQLTLTSGTFDVSIGSLTLTSTGESSSARISGSGSGTISGDVTVERFIEYQDGSANGSHWRFMASPLGGALDQQQGGGGGEHDTYRGPPLLSNTWTQGDGIPGANTQISGADASVFYYDETASVGSDASGGWAAVGDLKNPTGGSNIESQEGFAAYLFQDRDFDGTDEGFPLTLSVTGTVPASENDGSDVALPVSCTDNDGTGSDGCTDPNDGWNLVANPFVSHVEWNSGGFTRSQLESNAYVYDADNGVYQQTDGTNGGDVFIAPFQAFFIKSNAMDGNEGNAALSVNSGAKADPSASGDREFKSKAEEPLVSLQLTDGTDAEETRVTFRDGAEAGDDRYDGYQLTPLAADYHLIASKIDGRGGTYDSQYRPLPAGDSLEVDLAVTTTSRGTYTIEVDTLRALPTDLQVKVVDTQTGETADLRAGESLSFTVESSEAVSSEATSPRELLAGGPVQKAAASGVISGRFDLQVISGAAIPVEPASFDAAASEGDVDLKWQTASETNNAGFAVERKAKGGAWSQVGFREGAGTTDQAQTYRFTDTGVPFEAERVTYRLRQEDLDGTASHSEEVTVRLGAPSETTLHAPFPNPTQGSATLRYETPEATDLEIAVYDVLGRRVRTLADGPVEAGRHEQTVSVSDLPAGTYFVRLQAEGQTRTQKLTVFR
jgi:hypothetical protein